MAQANAPLAIFAHPGHELRILHTLGQLEAACLYLTDASGSTGHSRIPLTAGLLKQSGLPERVDFPFIPDAELYAGLHRHDERLIGALALELDRVIEIMQPRFLITDAAEGYNPAHDICHFIAVRAGNRHGLDVYDIALDADPADYGHATPGDCMDFSLDRGALAWKLDMIRQYIALAGEQLAQEAGHLLALYGEPAQGCEILRPALDWPRYDRTFEADQPFFERHGRQRVREGKYASALTYRDHLRPLLAAMMQPA
ncbi:hypothetical protein V0U79_09545 [Hyphobacterium sp. HN65]|uniref:PIG-L family deacetylase n=1 Tax=Hyphobacterium lacteum TaxID=3116575 RepID=A0ABU7LRR9_9PROT|nr:hypothetical protein [Hyphobacterium sp. HN65]MEE2526610.1 hypothetical protein [Hyphobacterium sp. HN65]